MTEQIYLNLLQQVITTGEIRSTRNGMTRSLFHAELVFDLRQGFPLLTTKKMFWRGIIEELLFFLRGDTNTHHLEEKGVHIWQPNTSRAFLDSHGFHQYEEGDMGPMYGFIWRHYGATYRGCKEDYTYEGWDQWSHLLDELTSDPTSRRLLMTTLDLSNVHKGVLWPCHSLVLQFYVEANNVVSVKMTQRSADVFLGLPFNIASTSALLCIVCHICTQRGTPMTPGRVIISLGDVHLYESHLAVAQTQLTRTPYSWPSMTIKSSATRVEDLCATDFVIKDYQCHDPLKTMMIA